MRILIKELKALITEALSRPDARSFFKIPKDFKTNFSGYTGYRFDEDLFYVGFAFIPLSKLSAEGAPSEAGAHVFRMKKLLKSGKKFPPIAVRITDDGKFECRDGNTRVLALKLMKATGKVPAVVVSPRLSELTKLEQF